MHWFIQCTDLSLGWHETILAAVQSRGLPWSAVGIIESDGGLAVTGLPEENWRERSFTGRPLRGVFWGSTGLMRAAAGDLQQWIRPGAWWEDSWWDPISQESHPAALNTNGMHMEAWHLKHAWIGTRAMFVKSVRPKVLTGQVLEPTDEDRIRWQAEHAGLAESELLAVYELDPRDPVMIDAEIRWFVVAGKIITGSYYKIDGCHRQRVQVDELAWQAARDLAAAWLPAPNCTMDLARLRDGSWKVVEFNCLGSSGFYAGHDAGLVVDAIEREFAGELLG